MELTEEQKKFKEESLELLKQANDADYKAFLKKVNEKANINIPLDTKIEYSTGRCCGFEGIGLILSGIIRLQDQVVIARFDRPMRTKREGGECHACVDVFSLGRGATLELEPKQGEYVIFETTIGDKDSFCKIVNSMWDYTDHRGYLVEDPHKIFGVKSKADVPDFVEQDFNSTEETER